MNLTVSFDREVDARWIASVAELPGAHAYGTTRDEALAAVQAIAFSILADEIQHGERDPRTVQSVVFLTDQAA